MNSLKIRDLSYKYPSAAEPIFSALNLDFEEGWSAVAGINGSGKSTLLKLISKELKTEKGMILGNDLVVYCAQSTEFPPQQLEKFMMTYTKEAYKLRDLLQVKDEWLGTWKTLSHGERKRLQLAVALSSESDVLMVDEPTNHLDSRSQAIVIEALRSYKGIGILVSHDRTLLDALTQQTIMIKAGEVLKYRSKFSLAHLAYGQTLSHKKKVITEQENELKKINRVVQVQREKVSLSKKRFSKKGVGKSDSSMKEKINGAILTGKDKHDGQMLQRTVTKQRHLSENMNKLSKEYATGISFEGEIARHNFPIALEKNCITLFESTQLCFPRLSVDIGDKVGVSGENGAGKSTFISYFIEKIDFQHDYLYIPQEITDKEAEQLFTDISNLNSDEKGELFTLVQRLGSDAKALLNSSIPSPGEVRKLLIAQGLLKRPSLIILDEPTNHMDLDSIESLEASLKEYEGVLLFITHDETFLENLSTKRWVFDKSQDRAYTVQEIL
ncbi:ABC transporter, ATP-binding protein [Sulfurimonas gotlandica GD1]|uniref:ABC transporter, ATP-binding protein n=1 Tax=Sulfurimonas gotlandica (strain DSM 19862 / JCM 16533 / GD1) TaxID=929558 RepID=H1FZN9_SULGG|nr:ATP-binding cassette domain-containing protein [Sulfurimonas gotlandica]EHP31046.1 ABC transporter, ATP-binding protein [Sulfurimonas gotlandica GD1]